MDGLLARSRTRLFAGHVTMRCDHGGNLHRLARELRCSASEILDYSASINPLGPSLSVMRVLRKALWMIRHYPIRISMTCCMPSVNGRPCH